jgi:membrane protease YdiL (CAAX protease family)
MKFEITPQERNLLFGQLTLLGVVFALLSTGAREILDTAGLFQLPTAKTLSLGILFGVTGTAVNLSIVKLLQNQKFEPLGFQVDSSPLVTVAISLCAPISEEIIFRGVFQPALGIMYTSIIFALIHAKTVSLWNLFTSKMFLGFWLGFAFMYSGNLWVPIIAHLINNLWTTSYGGIFFKELKKAIELTHCKKYSEALTILEKFPRNYSNAYALRWRSAVFWELGRFDEAIEDANYAITYGDAYAHAMRGIAHYKLQHYDSARADIDFICKQFPYLHFGWHYAGLLAVTENRLDDALLAFEKALNINNTAIDLTNVGFTYMKLGKLDKAVSFCRKAAKKDPKSIICQKNLTAATSMKSIAPPP